MLNRSWYLALALLAAWAHRSVAQSPTWHAREGALPALITTRGDIERLVKEIIEAESVLLPGETVLRGDMMIMIMAFRRDGRGISSAVPTAAGLDTLRRYLGGSSDLASISLSIQDLRVYRSSEGLPRAQRVDRVSLQLQQTDGKSNVYRVYGYDREQVDKVADRIERFGVTFATWRSPKRGAMVKTATQVLALLLLPLALTLRDRRHAWLLYPTSAVLLVASYGFPFAAVFSNLTIAGAR